MFDQLFDTSQMQCDSPGCTESHEVYLHSRCHPDSPVWVKVTKFALSTVATVECAKCKKVVSQLLLA